MDKKFSYKDISILRSEIMGIAIIGILLCHISECQTIHGISVSLGAKIFAKGTAFVDMFMIMSGIGLYYSFSNKNDIVQFYKKRVFRLLPTYFIIALPYWIWKDMIINKLGIGAVLSDITFYSFIFEGVKRFWFIFAILICYALFPIIYNYIYKSGKEELRTFWAVIFSVGGALVLKLLVPSIYDNLKIMIDRIPAFILGVYLGKKAKDGVRVKGIGIFMTGFMCLTTQFIAHWDKSKSLHGHIKYYTNTILALFLLVLIICILRLLNSMQVQRCLRWLGAITMEVYLFHSLLKNVFNYPPTILQYIFGVVLLPILCAYLVHRSVERIKKCKISNRKYI